MMRATRNLDKFRYQLIRCLKGSRPLKIHSTCAFNYSADNKAPVSLKDSMQPVSIRKQLGLDECNNSKQLYKVIKEHPDLTFNSKLEILSRFLETNQWNLRSLTEESEFKKFMGGIKKDLKSLAQRLRPFQENELGANQPIEDILKWIEKDKERLELKKVMPRIGYLVKLMADMKWTEHELWELCERMILDYQFVVEFYETVNAIEGFTFLPIVLELKEDMTRKILPDKSLPELYSDGPKDYFYLISKHSSRIRRLYKILEREALVSIWYSPLKYYHRMLKALVMTKSPNLISFIKLENYIIQSISEVDTIETLMEIYFLYATSGRGSQKLFSRIDAEIVKRVCGSQLITIKDSPFNKTDYLVRYIESLKCVTSTFESYQISSDLQCKIYDSIAEMKSKLSIQDVIVIHGSVVALGLTEIENKDIQNLLVAEVEKFIVSANDKDELKIALRFLLEHSNHATISKILPNENPTLLLEDLNRDDSTIVDRIQSEIYPKLRTKRLKDKFFSYFKA